MKKISIIVLLCIAAISANAQLKVDYTGKVRIGELNYYNNNYGYGLYVGSTVSQNYNAGIIGHSVGNVYPRATCGVYGVTSNAITGMNYGVAGCIKDCSDGTGVIGAPQDIMGYVITGKYAGYFMGNVKITGTVNGVSISPSDLRLKDNIVSFTSQKKSTLDQVLNMNVVEYNYKPLIPSLKAPDSVSVDSVMKYAGWDTKRKHIGLIAQELRELYPDLVVEGEDGYLSINYIELVPVLIRSIQELKQELDEVKSGKKDNETAKARVSNNGFDEDETEDLSDATAIPASTASLAQNTPNPFTERTTIRFTLPEDTKNACICIFDMSGKMLKQVPVDASMQSITIEGYEFQAGMYIYSLLIDGKEVKTRRMILSK